MSAFLTEKKSLPSAGVSRKGRNFYSKYHLMHNAGIPEYNRICHSDMKILFHHNQQVKKVTKETRIIPYYEKS